MQTKSKKNINIVLVEPEIPNNTGNIGRTCVALGASLHLIEPLGFSLEEKRLRRAGLDYWPFLDLKIHKSLEAFLSVFPAEDPKLLFTTKAQKSHYNFSLKEAEVGAGSSGVSDRKSGPVWLFFGKETKGLSVEFLERFPEDLYKIPMQPETRSLNLANSVAIGAYEVYRQQLLLEG